MFRISEFPALLKVDLYGVRKRAPLWHSRADNNMTEGQRESGKSSILTGTTLRVYRLLFREGVSQENASLALAINYQEL